MGLIRIETGLKSNGRVQLSIVLLYNCRQMFFTNDDPRKKSIMQASLGGADKQILFNAEAPGDLAVDKEGKKLFWIDTALKKIEYADLTGNFQLGM